MNNEALAIQIMAVRSKADRSETYEEFAEHMEKYKFLRKRWEAVAGNAVIGFEIKPNGGLANVRPQTK